MIKFWKSAAKGKSGYPVRPPEATENKAGPKTVALETIQENEESTAVFEKNSKLSPNLEDVLSDRNTTKHFVHFMSSIGKLLIIKCWLELENFRQAVCKSKEQKNTHEGQLKICRTKSFDLDWNTENHDSSRKSNSHKNFKAKYRLSLAENSSTSCQNFLNDFSFLEYTGMDEISTIKVTDEAVNLFKKYIALEAPQQVELNDEIRKTVISNICQPDVDDSCFKPVQDLLLQNLEKYFEEFQSSSFYIKAQIDILTNGTLKLLDIINNESILFYFTEYLDQESCRILLEFLMAVMHFRENLINSSSTTAEDAQQDAIIIYEKYFSLQATDPVGFQTDIRLKVESDICRDGGPLYSCFDVPYLIVFKTLEAHVKLFLESEVYYKFLSEMVHSVDQMTSHHRSQSDCSSEFSISTQNTLLAMGDPGFQRKKRNHSVPDMTIDSNQLYNADSLWQRTKQDGLTLGRVNSLGRFESKFEPDPDKKGKSVLKKMVSKLVPNTSEVEEEMAWQIAHMIVKDVTDLTMALPDNEPEDT